MFVPILDLYSLFCIKTTLLQTIKSWGYWDFPGGSVVKTLPFNAGDVDSIPGEGAKIPHDLWTKNQNIKQAIL